MFFCKAVIVMSTSTYEKFCNLNPSERLEYVSSLENVEDRLNLIRCLNTKKNELFLLKALRKEIDY